MKGCSDDWLPACPVPVRVPLLDAPDRGADVVVGMSTASGKPETLTTLKCGHTFVADLGDAPFCPYCKRIQQTVKREPYSRREAVTVPWEEYAPRNEEEKYRIYCRSHDGELTLIATCATAEAVGVAIITLAGEGEFDEDCALGLLDALPPCETCEGRGKAERVSNASSIPPYDYHRVSIMVPCDKCKGSGVKSTGTWLLLPWNASAKQLTDAGKLLGKESARRGGYRLRPPKDN